MFSMQGKNAVIFGVANKRSIAWAIAQSLSQAGAKLAGFVLESDLRPGFTLGYFRKAESVDVSVYCGEGRDYHDREKQRDRPLGQGGKREKHIK